MSCQALHSKILKQHQVSDIVRIPSSSTGRRRCSLPTTGLCRACATWSRELGPSEVGSGAHLQVSSVSFLLHSAVAFVGPLSTGGENSLASDLRFHHRRSASPCLLRSLSSKSLTRFRSMGQAVHAWKLGALDHESRLAEARIRKRQLQYCRWLFTETETQTVAERQKSSLL